jgi:hypothetical protein
VAADHVQKLAPARGVAHATSPLHPRGRPASAPATATWPSRSCSLQPTSYSDRLLTGERGGYSQQLTPDARSRRSAVMQRLQFRVIKKPGHISQGQNWGGRFT